MSSFSAMQVAAINDNALTAFQTAEAEKKQRAARKLGMLSTLRGELARLDPATNAPLLLQDTDKSPEKSVDGRFPAGWLHELWSAKPRDHAAVTAWALSVSHSTDKPILWITTAQLLREQGLPYGPGLLSLGINPERFILVRARSLHDSLWALEEGIKSEAFASVIGELDDIDITSSRRLSLAVQTHKARCMLLVRRESKPQTVAYSRWCASPQQSIGGNDGLPGNARLHVALDKHRGGARPHQTILEWQDATHRFHMVSSLADRPLVPGTKPGISANGHASRQLGAAG